MRMRRLTSRRRKMRRLTSSRRKRRRRLTSRRRRRRKEEQDEEAHEQEEEDEETHEQEEEDEQERQRCSCNLFFLERRCSCKLSLSRRRDGDREALHAPAVASHDRLVPVVHRNAPHHMLVVLPKVRRISLTKIDTMIGTDDRHDNRPPLSTCNA